MELLHIVERAKALDGLNVAVEFDTGEKGVFNCSYLLSDPYWLRLKEPTFFRTARAEYGPVVWDDNIDVAPESVGERAVVESNPQG